MIELIPDVLAKVEALQAMSLAGEAARVAELVAVYWPAPTGTVYYSSAPVDEIFPELQVSPVEMRLWRESDGPFREVIHESGISDETIDLDFWDADGDISDLFHQHGAGVRVEIFYYFPDVDLLLSQWHGHLQPPEDADEERFVARAEQGFRSSMLPLPRRAFFSGCQAVDGVLLSTLEEIAENDCPRDMHLGGSVGVAGKEHDLCPRRSRADCIAHIGDDLSMLAFDTAVESILNNQTKGPALLATSRGNETNLKRPLRVIAGRRTVRDLDLLAYTPQTNTNHPDKGFVRCLFAICEGRVRSISNCKVNDVFIGFEHLNVRKGARRQPRTSFSPGVSNYSGTALFFGVYGQVDPSQYGPSNLRGEATVEGKDDVRVYTDEESFTEEYTQSRAWWLLEALRNKRWGDGRDVRRLVISDYVHLDAWGAEQVAFTGSDGTLYTGARTTFNAELTDRSAQQQVNDICMAGRFGLPFSFQGKTRVVALEKVSDLSACPVFTDYGEDRNIIREESGKSTLTRTIISDVELPNRIVLTFDDEAHDHIERPLTFEDVEQQLLSGRAFGDTSRRVVEKKYAAFGVTNLGEAGRLGNLLLDLGEFDEGGLKNNLRITFTTWYAFTLTLHKYKVIRVVSKQLERYGFEYFRIRSMKRLPNLQVEISAQAYPVDYYELLEDQTQPPPIPGTGAEGNDGGVRGSRPRDVVFDLADFGNDHIRARLLEVS